MIHGDKATPAFSDQVWTFQPPLLYYLFMSDPGLTFMHCFHYPRCTANVDKRLPDYFTVQIMSQGRIELFYDTHRYELSGAWFWACWPGPHIRFHPFRRAYWCHRYVSFKGPLVNRWIELGLLPFMPQRPSSGTRYVQQFDRLLDLVHRDDRLGRYRAINLLEAILFQLADERQAEGQLWIDQVRERVARQATLWPDYQLVADEMGVGLSTLRRTFRQQAGVALHQDQLRRRVKAAQDLLVGTSLPIKTIAQNLGYRDVYFFSRQFRLVSGLTPGVYRSTQQRSP